MRMQAMSPASVSAQDIEHAQGSSMGKAALC